MKKVILNKSYGGFGLSTDVYVEYAKRKNLSLYKYKTEFEKDEEGKTHVFAYKCPITESGNVFIHFTTEDCGDKVEISKLHSILDLDESCREDEEVISIVESLGERANDRYSNLVIVEIPDDVAEDYVIDNYDGIETLHKRVQEW